MKVENLGRKLSCALLASSVLMSGCGGLGEGVLPVSAAILPLGGLSGATTVKAYNCLNTGLSYIVTFSNGSSGDFTSRSTYSSSNEMVAKVSNGDLPVPNADGSASGFFYPRGTVLPANSGTGTATITVQYLSFSNSIDVTVGTPQNFRIVPASADLAAKTTLDLAVFADLGGVETALDSAVTWAIETPDDNIATINTTTGTITGVAANSKVLIAKPSILGCTNPSVSAQANVTVDTLQSLALSKEFTSGDLVVNTTERIIATGTLINGKTQDLSNQVTYTSTHSTDPSVPAASTDAFTTKALIFLSGTVSNLAFAVRAVSAPASVGASFVYPAAPAPAVTPAPVVAQTIEIRPIAATLSGIAVTPSTVNVLAGAITQFNAVGNFADGVTQDITRHVAWQSSNTAQASILGSTSTAVNGLAGRTTTAGSAAGNAVTITATSATITPAATATATLNIQ